MNKTVALLSACGLLLGLPTMAPAASLTEVMERAQRFDARVPVSQAMYRADHARAALDRASLLPQVSATAGIGENSQSITSEFFGTYDESYQDSSLALQLRQPLFRWDLRSRWSRSTLRTELARSEEMARIQDFLTRVVDRYSGVLEAGAELSYATAEAEALRSELDTISDRAEVGLTTVTALRETQARAALAQANLLLADDALRQAEDALLELIGAPLPTLRPLPAQLPELPLAEADREAFVARAVESALEVRVAKLNLAIARSEVKSAIAEAAPKLDLVGELRDDDTSDSSIGQERESSRIGIELSIPLYAGGASYKALQAARADVENYAAQLELARRVAGQEARNAWRAVQTQYHRLDALSAAADAARIALDATRDGVEIGRRTQLDLLEARSALLRAERDHVLARYALLRAVARREAAIGDLDAEDPKRFETLFSGVTASPS